VLGAALLLPLGLILMVVGQLPGTTFASPTSLLHSDASVSLVKRPVGTNAEPPPTLVPPTATPKPTATAVPAVVAQPTATAAPKKGTYTVQPGDELKHIAAEYQVSIWKIIAANDIPNPDSLKIGQELRIPEP
jgi:LysM repeat protein